MPRILSYTCHFVYVTARDATEAKRIGRTIVEERLAACALGRALLRSQSIAHRSGRPVPSVGPHELRSIVGMREMYVVAS